MGQARRFLAIEGADAAGKTTIGEALDQAGIVRTFESPAPPFGALKHAAVSQLPPLGRLLFFLAGNLHIAEQAVASSYATPTLSVRYIWSTLAYYSALEEQSVGSIIALMPQAISAIPLPEVVVHLTVKRDEQRRRLKGRHDDDRLQRRLGASDDFQVRIAAAYEEAFALLRTTVVPIDTSNTSVSDTVAEVATAFGLATI
jgi:thymidylate kinase